MNYIKKKVVTSFSLLVMACALQAVGFCDQMVFVDVNGPNPGGGPYSGDAYGSYYYVSPYYGKDLTTGQSNILLFCLDSRDQFRPTMDGNHSLSAFHSGGFQRDGVHVPVWQRAERLVRSNLRAASAPAVRSSRITPGNATRWRHAYSAKELSLLGPGLQSTSAAFARDRAVYQYAVWEVFLENNYTVGDSTYNYYNDFMSSFNVIGNADHNFKTDVKAVLDEALTNYSTADLSGWTVVSPATPNTPGSEQEFLSRSFAINPEPSSIVLLGTIILFGAIRLRRQVRQG